MAERLPPVHPGEILREEFLVPLALTPYALAQACGVPRTRIERLAREETPVTADTALRLARYFGTTPEFWMNLQAQYELERAQDAAAASLRKIQPRQKGRGVSSHEFDVAVISVALSKRNACTRIMLGITADARIRRILVQPINSAEYADWLDR